MTDSPNFDAYLNERLTDPEVRAGFDAAESEPAITTDAEEASA